jgi:arsenate reductase (thioredoxin)
VLVMAERGIDISSQRSKEVLEYIRPDGAVAFDYLITVCRMEDRACPAFPGRATREYWPLDDPARAEAGQSPAGHTEVSGDDGLGAFREVRDELEARVRSWLESHRRVLHPRRRSQTVGVGG